MTGYGKGLRLWQDKKLGIEIRCVNSKVLDATWRWSGPYKELENELRGVVADRLQRGKVEISVSVRREGEDTGRLPSLRTAYMDAAYAQIEAWCAGKTCAAQTCAAQPQEASGPKSGGVSPGPGQAPHGPSPVQAWWPVLMAQSLIVQPEAWNRIEEEEYSEDELRAAGVELRALLNEVLDAVDGFRKQEGTTLKQDLLLRVSLIEQKLSEIEPFEQGRLPRIKEKLQKALQEWDAQWESRSEVRARFEEGLIYYLEKWDVTEEKVRLAKHCRYFRESVDEEGAGKKLGFIAQEMGREINTLGSKSNEVEMQKKVVEMKDELEKIKEQLFNIL